MKFFDLPFNIFAIVSIINVLEGPNYVVCLNFGLSDNLLVCVNREILVFYSRTKAFG